MILTYCPRKYLPFGDDAASLVVCTSTPQHRYQQEKGCQYCNAHPKLIRQLIASPFAFTTLMCCRNKSKPNSDIFVWPLHNILRYREEDYIRSTTCRFKSVPESRSPAHESNIHYAHQNKTLRSSSILVPLLCRTIGQTRKTEDKPVRQLAAFSLGLGTSVGYSAVVTVIFYGAIISTTAAKFTWEIKFCTN